MGTYFVESALGCGVERAMFGAQCELCGTGFVVLALWYWLVNSFVVLACPEPLTSHYLCDANKN
jgi:hypothetical protein